MTLAFKVGQYTVPDITGTNFPVTTKLGTIVTELLRYLFPIAGLLLFAYLIMGGFSYLTSAGDPKAMEQAKGKVTNAIVGFIIIFVAFWVVQILEFMFGIEGSMFTPKP
ncbi:MAG: pilin [Candidatus Gottesmanbacteria bacterium]